MASYPPPNNQQGSIFNPIDWIEPNAGSIDTAYLNEHYCQFPVAQGSMSFAGINNTGTTTIKQNIVMTGTPNVNFIEFPDGTKQYTAVAGSDILNDANNWSGVNNFNPLPTQPYASTMSQGITLTNNQNNSIPAGDNDIISYTPSSTQGLCIYSSSTSSVAGKPAQIVLQPDGVKTSLFANGINGVVQLNALGGTQSKIILQASSGVFLQLAPTINFNDWGTLSATSTGGIKSSVNFTSPSFSINDGVDDNYQLYSQNTGSYGFVIANTSGGSGTLTISNGSSTLTTLTSTTDGLSSNTAVLLPAQTTYNPLTTYGNVASTQQFVQQAIASQGGGDVSLAGTNNFTGINTFNTNPPTSTVIQSSLNTTQFATIKYVNGIVSETYPANALSDGEYVGGGGAGSTNTSNVTGSITGNYIGLNTIQVLPTTVTCNVSLQDASKTITFDLARALAPNNLYSSSLSGLSATITNSVGQMSGCQLIYGYNGVSQVYTLSVFVNINNYFYNSSENFTISFSGIINYIPL